MNMLYLHLISVYCESKAGSPLFINFGNAMLYAISCHHNLCYIERPYYIDDFSFCVPWEVNYRRSSPMVFQLPSLQEGTSQENPTRQKRLEPMNCNCRQFKEARVWRCLWIYIVTMITDWHLDVGLWYTGGEENCPWSSQNQQQPPNNILHNV